MKKNKILFILIALFLFCYPNDKVNAIAQLNCEYEGILKTYCGDAGSDNCKVKVTIKLEKNKWATPTITWVNGLMPDVKGCGAGDNVSDCLQNYNPNNMNYSIDKNIKVLKNNGSRYEITTDNYTDYFLNANKSSFQCPNSINVMRNENTNALGIFVVPTGESFDENLCANGTYINEFLCTINSNGRDNFELSRQVSAMPYTGGNIDTGNSSGSCCVYNFSNVTKIYTYLLTSTTGSTSYAVCLGSNCMTAEPNLSKKAAFMSVTDDSRWGSYHNMLDCSSMPENIWYSTSNGTTKFFPFAASEAEAGGRVFTATLDTNDYCESNVYSDDGVVDNPDPGDNNGNSGNTHGDGIINWGDPADVSCDGIIGEELLDFINKIFRWIRILAPIVVILLSSVEFAGALLQDDRDALKKASSKFIKRLIIAVALFLVPLVLEFILNAFNEITKANTDICNIGK